MMDMDDFTKAIDEKVWHTVELGYAHEFFDDMRDLLVQHAIVGAMLHGGWVVKERGVGNLYGNFAISFTTEEDLILFKLKGIADLFRSTHECHHVKEL